MVAGEGPIMRKIARENGQRDAVGIGGATRETALRE
jgi:hypothetical protein